MTLYLRVVNTQPTTGGKHQPDHAGKHQPDHTGKHRPAIDNLLNLEIRLEKELGNLLLPHFL